MRKIIVNSTPLIALAKANKLEILKGMYEHLIIPELGYTQAFVATLSDFSVSFISDLENDKSTAELGKAIDNLRYAGDNDELYFRDYLNAHPDVAKAYELLKLRLWKQYEHNRDAYTTAKTAFISEWTAEARKEYGDRY